MNAKTLLLAACAAMTVAAVPALAQGDVPLIPREKIFGNPDPGRRPPVARRQVAVLDRAARRRAQHLGRAGRRPARRRGR